MRNIIRIFDFVEDTPPRKKASSLAFFNRLIRTLAAPKILPLGKMQVNLLLRSLIRTLALPKILSFGKMQVNLLLRSLIRIFAENKKNDKNNSIWQMKR